MQASHKESSSCSWWCWSKDGLEKLVGGCDWLGRGSRIIIKTMNKDMLIAHQALLFYKSLWAISISLFLVTMILLPLPNQSHPSANFSNLSLHQDRKELPLCEPCILFLTFLSLVLPNSVSNSHISERIIFCRSSSPLILLDFSLTSPRKHAASKCCTILSYNALASSVIYAQHAYSFITRLHV